MKICITLALLFVSFYAAHATVRVYDGEGTWQRGDASGILQVSYTLWAYPASDRHDIRLQLQVSAEESYDFSVAIVPRATTITATAAEQGFDLRPIDNRAESVAAQVAGTGTCSRSGYERTCEMQFTLGDYQLSLHKIFKPARRGVLRLQLSLSGTLTENSDTLQWSSELTFNLDRSVECLEQPQTCAPQ